MLVLTRKIGEKIQIGDDITITVTRVDMNSVKLGIDAPTAVAVAREELVSVGAESAVRQAALAD